MYNMMDALVPMIYSEVDQIFSNVGFNDLFHIFAIMVLESCCVLKLHATVFLKS